jgi:YD repeat-containing protein
MPLSSCAEAICNPTISTSNNRMASTGWEYDSSGNTTGEPDGRTFVYDEENKLGAAFISAKTQLCRLVLAERFAVKFCRCFKHRIRSVFAYWQKRSFMPDCFPHR